MFEKIQKISNPLTIIAIFAGIAEVVSTGALINVNVEVQIILVWFVMLFPVFLAILFFLTLNFNPQVLYAPSDFQNEDNYLNTLRIKKSQVQVGFTRLNEELESSTDKILEKVIDRIGQEAESQRQSLRNTIANEIEEVKTSFVIEIIRNQEVCVFIQLLDSLPLFFRDEDGAVLTSLLREIGEQYIVLEKAYLDFCADPAEN